MGWEEWMNAIKKMITCFYNPETGKAKVISSLKLTILLPFSPPSPPPQYQPTAPTTVTTPLKQPEMTLSKKNKRGRMAGKVFIAEKRGAG